MEIHVLKNHHGNKTTIVYDNWCLNGCQFFHKDEAETIFNEYDVSEQHRQDVLELFEDGDLSNLLCDIENSNGCQENLSLLMEVLSRDLKVDFKIPYEDVNDYKHIKHWILAVLGYKPHLDQLVNSDEEGVRLRVADHDYEDLLNILVHDKCSWVRVGVAKHDHKDLLDILVRDENPDVRINVGRHDHKDLLDILVDDCNESVRYYATLHGYPEHLEKAAKDGSEIVRELAMTNRDDSVSK